MSAFLKHSCKIAIAGSLAIAFSNETEHNISRGFSANALLINMKSSGKSNKHSGGCCVRRPPKDADDQRRCLPLPRCEEIRPAAESGDSSGEEFDGSSGDSSGSSPASQPSTPERNSVDGCEGEELMPLTRTFSDKTIMTTLYPLGDKIPIIHKLFSHHGSRVMFENARQDGDVRLGDVVKLNVGATNADDIAGGLYSRCRELGIKESFDVFSMAFVVHEVNRDRTELVLKTLFHKTERESTFPWPRISMENVYTFKAIIDPQTHKVTSLRNDNDSNHVGLKGLEAVDLQVLPGIEKAYGAPCESYVPESDVPNSKFTYEVIDGCDPTHGEAQQSIADAHHIQLSVVGVRAVHDAVSSGFARSLTKEVRHHNEEREDEREWTQSKYSTKTHNCQHYAQDVVARLIYFNDNYAGSWARLQPELENKWFELSDGKTNAVEHAFNREVFLTNESNGSLHTQLSFVIYHFLRFADVVNTTTTEYMLKTFDENFLDEKLYALYSAAQKMKRLHLLTAPVRDGDVDKLSFINFHLDKFKKSECQDTFFNNLLKEYELCFTKQDFGKIHKALVEARRTPVSVDDIALIEKKIPVQSDGEGDSGEDADDEDTTESTELVSSDDE